MKKLSFIFLYIVLFGTGCKSFLKEENEENSKEEKINIYSKELKDYPSLIQEIIVSEKGLIRGVRFGLTKQEIRGIEQAKFAESDEEAHFLLAESELSDDVNLDIEYHFYQNELKQLTLVVYTLGSEQQEVIYENLVQFLSSKFQLDPNLTQWSISNNLHMTIKKAGNRQECDIELILYQL